jgi:hypothetical protein
MSMRRSAAQHIYVHCEQCRVEGLPSPGAAGEVRQSPGDYFGACHDAMNHIRETGHEPVTVISTQTAVYGRLE